MTTPLIVAALVIGAIWAVYLLPTVFGERGSASISSTEEFDRWTHSMAHVQKHTAADLAASHKDQIRTRRRRTLMALAVLAVVGFIAAAYFGSLPLLLTGLLFTTLFVLYVTALAQMKQRRLQRLKVTHVSERPTEWDEPQVKVIAN
jgi:NADH:ubiquinone oxidoreductase subunit 2 (subunit N)